MKGRAGIITVLIASLLAAAYTLVWPLIPTPASNHPPAAPHVSVTDTRPTDKTASDEPLNEPALPEPSSSLDLSETPPFDPDLVAKFAEAFAAAFARPDPGDEDAWLVAVAGYLNLDMQQAVDKIGPHLVPYETVTGPATVEGDRWPYLVSVPTDTGPLTVTVCPDTTGEPGVDERMTVCGIDLGGHP